MGFVQAAFLGALLALAVPIIIHLMFRRRTRRVDLGTLRFLRVVLQENARRRRVKRWLLLAMRLACVALLALLFARPYLIAQQLGGTGQRFIAVLIDRSATMELRDTRGRLIDQAVAQARRIVRQSGEETRVEVAFFDHDVRPLGVPLEQSESTTRSTGDMLSALVAPERTFAATDYGRAMAWARDVCINAPQQQRELHIFTDLQRSGLDWSEAEPLPEDVVVHLHDLGRDLVNNVAVTAALPSKAVIRPDEPVGVSATVLNASPFPLENVPVVLSLESGNRRQTLRERVNLEPGTAMAVDFDVPPLAEGLWQGSVTVEINDDLAFDNRRYLAVLAAPPLRVVLVDGDVRGAPEPAAGLPSETSVVRGSPDPVPLLPSETYFLEAALRLAPPGETYPESPFEPVVARGRLPSLERADLVVVANVGQLGADEAAELERFVFNGGGLLVFTGENVEPGSERSWQRAGLAVGRIAGTQRSDHLPWRIESWDEVHSLFKPLNDPQHGDLRRLAFRAYTRIQPADDVRVLARFQSGDPALLERSHGRGRLLWFTSACGRQWSDWTRSRLYLPLMHQMLGYLAGLTEGGPIREVVIDSSDTAAQLVSRAESGNGQRADRSDLSPGIYERNGYWEVVNPSPRESETDRCTPEEFANRFEFTLHEAEQPGLETAEVERPATAELRDDEIWHWLVFALLAMLCVECFLANRTSS